MKCDADNAYESAISVSRLFGGLLATFAGHPLTNRGLAVLALHGGLHWPWGITCTRDTPGRMGQSEGAAHPTHLHWPPDNTPEMVPMAWKATDERIVFVRFRAAHRLCMP